MEKKENLIKSIQYLRRRMKPHTFRYSAIILFGISFIIQIAEINVYLMAFNIPILDLTRVLLNSILSVLVLLSIIFLILLKDVYKGKFYRYIKDDNHEDSYEMKSFAIIGKIGSGVKMVNIAPEDWTDEDCLKYEDCKECPQYDPEDSEYQCKYQQFIKKMR